jgi:hypothetical protein
VTIIFHDNSREPTQTYFHENWGYLSDPHVRALAWLLDAPNLLNPLSLRWEGKIATLMIDVPVTKRWLEGLDRNPLMLQKYLGEVPITRLGRYAEKLLAFYFESQGVLLHHGLQINNTDHQTVGEFDFLLRGDEGVVHWEFATKFYLFEGEGEGEGEGDQHSGEDFVGPNLADTLGAKMQKILHRQLALGQHPAVSSYLDQPIVEAKALIRGWLFYRNDGDVEGSSALAPQSKNVLEADANRDEISGIFSGHCFGFWCTADEFRNIGAERVLVLPRLAWLAPAQVAIEQTFELPAMAILIQDHFKSDQMPLLVALMRCDGDNAIEVSRGFVVPNDWRERAGERRQRSVLARG